MTELLRQTTRATFGWVFGAKKTLPFSFDSSKTKADITSRMQVRISSLILLHILTKGIIRGHDGSAGNEVRVIPCFADFWGKWGYLCGNRLQEHSFKSRIDNLLLSSAPLRYLRTLSADGGRTFRPPDSCQSASPEPKLSENIVKFYLKATDDVTGQVKSKIFDSIIVPFIWQSSRTKLK